jgi:hypothetical protein
VQIEVTQQNIAWIQAIILLAFALPAPPLVLAWRAFLKQNHGRRATIALGILSLSYVWVVGVIAGLPVIAPHYTEARENIIDANAAGVLVAVLLVVVSKQLRPQLLVAGPLIFVLWIYLAVIGSVL